MNDQTLLLGFLLASHLTADFGVPPDVDSGRRSRSETP